MLGNRKLKRIFSAAFQKQHYIALVNMARVYPDFMENISRYLTGKGEYPYDIKVRTPIGIISMRLYSHHDLLTVNEIFCRHDYFADSLVRFVVDLGSNIGISALYFLTRNNDSKCILYEPDPKNLEKLHGNLRGFDHRYTVVPSAVSDKRGKFEFGVEPTGRYGGIGLKTGEKIIVDCISINEVIKSALQDTSPIDILKIDTEGVEIQTVEAIEPELLQSISTVYLESRPNKELHNNLFYNRQYGSVLQLLRKQA